MFYVNILQKVLFEHVPHVVRLTRHYANQSGLVTLGFVIYFTAVMLTDTDNANSRQFDHVYYLLLATFFLTFTIPQIVSLLRSKAIQTCFLFLAFMWLTPLWTGGMNTHEWTTLGRRSLEVVLFAMTVAAMVAYHHRFVRWLPVIIAGVAASTAIYSIIRFFIQTSGQIYGVRLVTFPFPNENTGPALYGLIVAGLVFHAWDSLRRSKTMLPQEQTSAPAPSTGLSRESLFCLSVSALLVVDILLASTRSALVGLIVAGLVFLAFSFFQLSRKGRTIYLLVLAVIIMVSAVILMSDIGKNLLRGTSMREELLVGFWKISIQQFWTGHGMQNEFRYKVSGFAAPHHQLLTAMLYGGIVGALLLFAHYVTMLWIGFRLYRKEGSFVLLAMVIYLIMHCQFETVIFAQSPDWRWLLLWAPVGLAAGVELRLMAKG